MMNSVGWQYPLVAELWQVEKQLSLPAFLEKAKQPDSSVHTLLDKAWKEIPTWKKSFEVISALRACEIIALKIHKTLPEYLNEKFSIQFKNDSWPLCVKRSHLMPLLAESEPLSVLFNGKFSEAAKRQVSIQEISSSIFHTILSSFYPSDLTNESLKVPSEIICYKKELNRIDIIFNVLEAGCFMMNKTVICASVKQLVSQLRFESDLDLSDSLHRLIKLTLNNLNTLRSFDADTIGLVIYVEEHLSFAILSIFSHLQNAVPSWWNSYHSTVKYELGRWNELVSAIQMIDEKIEPNAEIKTKLNQRISARLDYRHKICNRKLLGEIGYTIQILEGLLTSGFSRDEIVKRILEYSEDLKSMYSQETELIAKWEKASQKLLESHLKVENNSNLV